MALGNMILIKMVDWTQEETEVPGDNTHLWEESWDDDDTSEDFSAQLKYVLPYTPLGILFHSMDGRHANLRFQTGRS